MTDLPPEISPEKSIAAPTRPWTDREHLRALAEGCDVHGVGFICRHSWDTLEGPAFDGSTALEYNAARARLAAAALKVLDELDTLRAAASAVLDYENHPSRLSLSRLRTVLHAR